MLISFWLVLMILLIMLVSIELFFVNSVTEFRGYVELYFLVGKCLQQLVHLSAFPLIIVYSVKVIYFIKLIILILILPKYCFGIYSGKIPTV